MYYETNLTNLGENEEQTAIQKFYDKTSIFVTGATGFLGKLLVEKLLRSCSTVTTIYILVRDKKGKNLQTRIDELLDDVIFEPLKRESLKFKHKIVGIAGDCSLPGLGISVEDRQLLTEHVSVIFHVAATVRFDEALKLALAINVQSVQEIIKLGRGMKNLKSLVHVSTAYSQCPNEVIEEKLYDISVDTLKLISVSENMPEDVIDTVTPAILGKWPNTYAFTKALAEDIIKQEGQELPIGVFRPSIVISTYQEPIRAWINNFYGPTGVVAGAGTGLLRVLHCDSKVNANVVPADMVVNAMIATGWEVGKTYQKAIEDKTNYEIPVYNYESSNDNPLSWKDYLQLSWKHGVHTPSMRAIWYYALTLQKTQIGYYLAMLFLHYLPALLIDGGLLCIGRAPRALKIYEKLHKFTKVIAYFSTRNWIFDSHRIRSLNNSMSDRDKDLFFCDLKKLEWDTYFEAYIRGIRVYIIKDPLETVPEARVKWNRLYWAHQLVRLVACLVFIRLIYAFFSILFNCL